MSPREFREARVRLGLSVEKLADEFGVHARTVQRWQNGKQDVPGPVARAMLLLAEQLGMDTEFMMKTQRSGQSVREP